MRLLIMKMNEKIWWTVTFLYLVIIYSTLSIGPVLWEALNNSLGGKCSLILYFLYSLLGGAMLLYIIFAKREKSLKKYLYFFLLMGGFYLIVRLAKHPAEKVHLGEYGLLGVFLYNCLKTRVDKFSKKLYFIGIVISIIAGALDEVIQGILPTRYFEWRDLIINGAAGALTLLIIRVNILRERA